MELKIIGKYLVIFGIILIGAGTVFWFFPKFFSFFGKLPGDIVIKKKDLSFYFPLTTCILVSLILTFIFWLLGKK
ncbi:DUF2905 domain-containing protein [Candidatus Auribacterota bacterium]